MAETVSSNSSYNVISVGAGFFGFTFDFSDDSRLETATITFGGAQGRLQFGADSYSCEIAGGASDTFLKYQDEALRER